jgi:hypothetical protein
MTQTEKTDLETQPFRGNEEAFCACPGRNLNHQQSVARHFLRRMMRTFKPSGRLCQIFFTALLCASMVPNRLLADESGKADRPTKATASAAGSPESAEPALSQIAAPAPEVNAGVQPDTFGDSSAQQTKEKMPLPAAITATGLLFPSVFQSLSR